MTIPETATAPDLREMIANTIRSAAHIPGSSDCDCEPALVIEASLMEGNSIIDAEIARLSEARETAVRAWRMEHDALDKADAELRQVRLVGEIFMERVDATRTALVSLDQAISGIGDAPAEAEVRAAYDDLVATLDLPEESM